MDIDHDSLSRLAHATGMTDVEFDERSRVEAEAQQAREREEEEAQRDQWCEGAGVPPDPFEEGLKAVARQREINRQAMESVHDEECSFMRPEDNPCNPDY